MGDRASRQPGTETRSKILDATAGILEEQGMSEATVTSIMERAGVSRTAFYRQFNGVNGVVAALLESLVVELFGEAGDWFKDDDAVGSRGVIWDNAMRDARAIKPRIRLFSAIVDAAALDESLRTMWRTTITQNWIDATAAAIRRDQIAGVIRPGLDPDSTALALTLMSEQLALEVLGRQDAEPDRYAEILTPIWGAVLFGVDDAG